jgi:hypothetical protein
MHSMTTKLARFMGALAVGIVLGTAGCSSDKNPAYPKNPEGENAKPAGATGDAQAQGMKPQKAPIDPSK